MKLVIEIDNPGQHSASELATILDSVAAEVQADMEFRGDDWLVKNGATKLKSLSGRVQATYRYDDEDTVTVSVSSELRDRLDKLEGLREKADELGYYDDFDEEREDIGHDCRRLIEEALNGG